MNKLLQNEDIKTAAAPHVREDCGSRVQDAKAGG